MCWNAPVSYGALIVGTLLNLLLVWMVREPIVWALAVFWQFVLLVQLFEGLYWSGISNGNGAVVVTLLQPIVLLLALIVVSPVDPWLKYLAAGLGVFYLVILISRFVGGEKTPASIQPLPGCRHLNIGWDKTLSYAGVAYFFISLAIMFLLVRPISFIFWIALYLILALAASAFIYPCGMGSLWCLFGALAPLVTLIAWKMTSPSSSFFFSS